MEVHHHPDIHHRKKRFKEYFLEFLMIFLAVTMGFFAESLREHISNQERTNVFARSLEADFKADTSTLHQLITFTLAKINTTDSIGPKFHMAKNRSNDSILYRNLLLMISTFQFDNINGTYQQIKNSGSLRFFNQSLVNNMNSYDATSLKLKLMEDWENKYLFEQTVPKISEMVNYRVFADLGAGKPISNDMYFRNINAESIDVLINQAEIIKRLRIRQLGQQKILLQKAEEILGDLNKEYAE
jgi:hypothetical protein